MYKVNEEFIEYASKNFEYGNSFSELLIYGNKFKEAGLTPMYIYDPEENSVYVTTEEKQGNKFH